MFVRSVFSVVFLGAVFSGLVACDQNLTRGGRCNSKTCGGCCDAQGVCQPGMSSNSCGTNAGMCLDCQGLQCVAGVCESAGAMGGGNGGAGGGAGSSGGGGGSSGTGGGGGGVGRVDQELVSGTRLKAVSYTSFDGARASAHPLFWDEALQQFCVVTVGGAYPIELFMHSQKCSPFLRSNWISLPLGKEVFAESMCKVHAAECRGEEQIGGKNVRPLTVGVASDGGTGLYTASVPVSSTYIRQSDGGCVPYSYSGTACAAAGREIMESELAVMNLTID